MYLWRVFLSTRASLLCGRMLCPCQLGVHSILHSSRGEGEEVFAFWAIKDDEETGKSTAVVGLFFEPHMMCLQFITVALGGQSALSDCLCRLGNGHSA